MTNVRRHQHDARLSQKLSAAPPRNVAIHLYNSVFRFINPDHLQAPVLEGFLADRRAGSAL